MTFDVQKSRAILSTMSPLPWIVLEDENGQMTIIRNPNHPMHRDGMEAWGRKEASETPDAMGIAYMRENFGAALDEIERLQAEMKELRKKKTYSHLLDQCNQQAKRIAGLEADILQKSMLAGSLANENAGLKKRIAELQSLNEDLMANCNSLRTRAQKAEDRIAELEGEIADRDDTVGMLLSRNVTYRAALKKLGQAKRERGKALVEERARRICHVPGDPVGHWARYEKVVVDEAREQLVHEGKL